MPSLFTQIINGAIPCFRVHEDELTLAIMDINPIQPGQILVIPKKEVGTIWDLEVSDYQALMATVKGAGRAIRLVFPDKARVGVIVEGLEIVDHAHVKVFPFSSVEEFHTQPKAGLQPSSERLEKLAKQLAF